MRLKMGLFRKNFTLVEMIVVSVIFGIISIATTILLISAQRSWNRQIAQIKMLESDAWGLDRLTMELRGCRQATVGNGRGGNGVNFDIDTGVDNIMDTEVWYWSLLSGCPSGNGNNLFYRGANAPLSANANYCPSAANTSPMGGLLSSATFDNSAGGGVIAVTINNYGHYSNDKFVVSNSADDLNFSLRTKIRARN